jgi:antitoxin ChpS
MTTVKLRRVGGSVMLPVPPRILTMANLAAGSSVDMVLNGTVLEIKASGPRYDLDQLLAECDYTAPRLAEDQEWIDTPARGRELL